MSDQPTAASPDGEGKHGNDNDVRKAAHDAVREMRQRLTKLGDDGLDLLFRSARSHHGWQDRPVSDEEIRELYEVVKWGPTSVNGNPARFIFVRSAEAKKKLSECVKPGNVHKVLAAPVTAIIAYDMEFWTELDQLHAHEDMTHMFRDKPANAEKSAFRNSTLQGAYFMIAARAMGFDVGPKSGFDNAKVDAAFFDGTSLKSNFLCSFGYADETAIFQRLPRLDFDRACEIL
ncbi:MAG: malonic semialdehyde reductase [Pseudomonadota bacterium]